MRLNARSTPSSRWRNGFFMPSSDNCSQPVCAESSTARRLLPEAGIPLTRMTRLPGWQEVSTLKAALFSDMFHLLCGRLVAVPGRIEILLNDGLNFIQTRDCQGLQFSFGGAAVKGNTVFPK